MGTHEKPVWVWVPGDVEPTLAGTFRLGEAPRPTGLFRYDQGYLGTPGAFALDPLHLPLGSRRELRSRQHDGLFGCLRDACPEGYGRDMLIHRYGLSDSPGPLTLFELSPGDGVGAIEVCDNIAHKVQFCAPPASRLLELMADLPPERHASKAVHQLLEVGTSMGGERPKITVEGDGALWMAKLQDRGDAPHMPARESIAMALAELCGIRAAQTRLHTVGSGREVLMVRRFDRIGLAGERVPYLSAHTVLGLDPGAMRGDRSRSYLVLADRARRMGVPEDDIKELWRRMAYNALIHNVDDHPRNHGFVLQDGRWRLSPAFDLVPFPPPRDSNGPVLALAVDRWGNGEATPSSLMENSVHFGYSPQEAGACLQQMAGIVAGRWQPDMQRVGVDHAFIDTRMAGAFKWCEAIAADKRLVDDAVEQAEMALKSRRRGKPSSMAFATKAKR